MTVTLFLSTGEYFAIVNSDLLNNAIISSSTDIYQNICSSNCSENGSSESIDSVEVCVALLCEKLKWKQYVFFLLFSFC